LIDGVDYIEEKAQEDATVHFPTSQEQSKLIHDVLQHYSNSTYLDYDAPSDHAKKVQQELAKEVKVKSKSKSKVESEEDEEEEEEEVEGEEDEGEDQGRSSENSEEGTSKTNPDKKVSGVDNNNGEVDGVNHTNGVSNTKEESVALERDKQVSVTTETESNIPQVVIDDKNITGKKRTEPEPEIVTTSTFRAKPLPPPVKKAFAPTNIVARKPK